MMGLIVSVLRDSYGRSVHDSLNHFEGDEVLVTNVEGPFSAENFPDMQRALLVRGHILGHVRLIPSGKPDRGMMGGNFAYSSDGRWHRAVENIAGSPQSGAVPIHDRFE